MKKRVSFFSSFVLIAIFIVSFFYANSIKINDLQAEIAGKEIYTYTLTGYQDYYPYHYFDNLSGATYSKNITYINKNGQEVSEYRAIISDSKNIFNSNFASGKASISLSGEMLTLAQTGHYYAYASAGLLAFENKDKSKIVITLSNSTTSQSVSSDKVYTSGVYNPDWVNTGKVFLTSSNDVLTFEFSSLDKSNIWNPSNFAIFEPSINFGIEIDKITTESVGGTVSSGSLIKLEASHFLSKLSGDSLIRYYQNIHEIEWEIVSGTENGQILGNYLNITGSNGNIVVRPKCLKSTDGTEYIYGDAITFTINSSTVAVSAKSNFDEGVKISGTSNNFSQNRYVNIFVEVLDSYSLLRVEDESGEELSYTITSSGLYRIRIYVSNSSKIINIILRKSISVGEIVIKDKLFDKTDTAEIENIIFNEGDLEHGVSVDYSSITAKFASALPGEDIQVNITGSLAFVGENAYMYELIGSLPKSKANILKRNIVVRAYDVDIEYGDEIPTLSYNIEGDLLYGEALTGQLEVETNGNIGSYAIKIGTLSNAHYNIEFVEGTLTISKRKIQISDIYIDDKIYDGTNVVNLDDLHYTKTGSFLTSHNISLGITAEYDGKDAGEHKVVFNFALIGNASDVYYYDLAVMSDSLKGTIAPKNLNIYANSLTKVYGEQDPILTYNYSSSDLLSGDVIEGNISRTVGENVGEYTITQGTLSAKNYKINFITAKFIIQQREISISAVPCSKTYGELDPQFAYSLTNGNILAGDQLGLTLSRAEGERIGTYAIKIASQINQNYKIYFTSANLVINKRQLNINILANNKKYDGQLSCALDIYINNDVLSDNLSLNIYAQFSDKNVGLWNLSYYTSSNVLISEFNSAIVEGNNVDCYDITFNVSSQAKIDKRVVTISIEEKYLSKVFGEIDKGFPFTVNNIVDGENLTGILMREDGEDAGFYNILQYTLTEENNPNYSLNFDFDLTYRIFPRDVEIVVDDKIIDFGEVECEIIYYVSNNTPLPIGIIISDILTGAPSREKGNDVGEYNYLIGTLELKEDCINNYNLIFNGGVLKIVAKVLTIQIDDVEKVYGSTDPKFTYYIIGNLDYDINIEFIRQTGENVGTYSIAGILKDNNYKAVINSGNLTIVPADITIKTNSILKTYGDSDPEFTYYLSSGMLKFNDKLEDVVTGKLIREAGENVGVYQIQLGNLIVNNNYNLHFVPAELTIVPKDLFVVANDIVKYYDEITEPQLTYQVSGLIFGDQITGNLTRVEGSEPGEYDILVGTLSAENYNIVFTSAKFSIQKRKITVEIDAKTKIFDGTDTIDLTYTLSGNILQGSEPIVTLFKEDGSDVGKYLIDAEVKGDIYEIEIITNYFEIVKRNVIVKADSFDITYGDEIPTLTYSIENDIENSQLSITLYRTQSSAAGVYTIYSSILNSENYNVTYIEGTLTINKRKIVIKTDNFVKVYGSADPIFEYEIIEGQLVSQDILSGAIIRESGENVGTYKLICELENSNYEIEMLSANLSITRKELILVTSVMDKVFDGSDVAYLRTPTLSGVISGDDVYFEYEKENVAKFVQSGVGNNIPVIVYGGQLAGNDCNNYYLTYPTDLTANITNAVVLTEDNNSNMFIEASNNNTALTQGATLIASDYVASEKDISEFGNSKSIVGAYNLSIKLDDKEISQTGKITVNIKPTNGDLNNVQVFRLNADGTKTLLNTTYDNGIIKFETEEMGVFIIVADNDAWLNITLIVSAAILIITIIGFVISKKFKKEKA